MKTTQRLTAAELLGMMCRTGVSGRGNIVIETRESRKAARQSIQQAHVQDRQQRAAARPDYLPASQ